MKKIAFFDAKPYDRESFDSVNGGRYDISYFEPRLSAAVLPLADGCDAVCAFVNDEIGADVAKGLADRGIRLLVMRCAGYNNVDFKAAYDRGLTVLRVPAYSPHAVAEHALALLMTLNRRLHKAFIRTRDFNFSLVGLTGFDMYGKTAGVVGMGKIGQCFAAVCRGLGMRVLAYDRFKKDDGVFDYVDLDFLLKESDVVSLHCPLTPENYHMFDKKAFAKMKKGVFIINTSRGGLIDSADLLAALRSGDVGGAGLDVYEEESDWFYEDRSMVTGQNDNLSLLISMPNVLVTSHQAFLTKEALHNIAVTTLANADAFFAGDPLPNEICYRCLNNEAAAADCLKRAGGRCPR